MQDTFIVPVDLSLTEWYELSFAILPKVKPLRMVFWMIAGVSLALGIPLAFSGGVFHLGKLLEAFIAPVFFLCFISAGMLVGGWYFDKFKPEYIRGFSCRFSHWGLEIAERPYQTSIAWRQFVKWEETRSLYLLYGKQNNVTALHYVQKRMLPVAGITADEFKHLLETNISAAP